MSLVALMGCEDRFDFPYGEISEGEGVVCFEVAFKDFSPMLTRSSGDAIKDIDKLWIVAYDAAGNLCRSGEVPRKKADSDPDEESFTVEEKDNARPDGAASSESKSQHAYFKLKFPHGRYRIYVVANLDLTGYDLTSEDKLQDIHVEWQTDDISRNSQMFGYFESTSGPSQIETVDDNGRFRAPIVVIGDAGETSLHAWLKRAASKITIAVDGSGLDEGVNVYLKTVKLKDISRYCKIGAESKAYEQDDLIETGEIISLTGEGESYDENYSALVNSSEGKKYFPRIDGITDRDDWRNKAHTSEFANSNSLFFFENMQGKGKDKNQKPATDSPATDGSAKPDKPYGTYMEVEAFYHCKNGDGTDEYGNVKYRFMLGRDVTTDYNASRNCHYRITLKLKGKANDADWNIEYLKQIFEVSPSRKTLNYQGHYFMPDQKIANLGRNFGTEGFDIVVDSFEEDQGDRSKKTPKSWTAKFRYDDGYGNIIESPTPPAWLEGFTVTDGKVKGDGGEKQKIRVKANPGSEDVDLDNMLKTASSKGTAASPHDLSGNCSETANCYIVDAPGTYSFPLVYGNAVAGEETYRSATAGAEDLHVFKNHLGHDITSPYIVETIRNDGLLTSEERDLSLPEKAVVEWQDELNLVDTGKVRLDNSAYGGKGGIVFSIGTIQQGNAVISVIDKAGRVMWSWHIWVTRLDAFDETITVTGNDRRKYDLMSMNLGWCSPHGEKIKYYRKRSCEVTFTPDDSEVPVSRKVVIVKESHIAFPQGNNPYYQWGRKDPSVPQKALWDIKPYYQYPEYSWGWKSPARFYGDTGNEMKGVVGNEMREDTRALVGNGLLIQHPFIWHNPPRRAISTTQYVSENRTYANLWGATSSVKTVYDPCPPGYMVGDIDAFSGFTVKGRNVLADEWDYMFNVAKDQIAEANPKLNVYELYTNPDKYQSIIFPETGYRDWDDNAAVYRFGADGSNGFAAAWTRRIQSATHGTAHQDAAYYLEISSGSEKSGGTGIYGYLWPQNAFYTCDGFPVRPCKMK